MARTRASRRGAGNGDPARRPRPAGRLAAGREVAYAGLVPSLYEPDFDELRDHPGFRAKRSRIGYQLGAERVGLSLWEIEPGEAAYPYHFHLAEEEVLVVLDGEPDLRTPEGWRRLERGEIVRFPTGEEGAHQLVNRTDGPVRFLAISTNGDPDIVVYPDSQKVLAAERRPRGGGFRTIVRLEDAVDYFDGERPPQP